jgi:hypothetical protein
MIIPDTGVYNRRESKSKKTKQTATPTGQEATCTNGSHSNPKMQHGKKEND